MSSNLEFRNDGKRRDSTTLERAGKLVGMAKEKSTRLVSALIRVVKRPPFWVALLLSIIFADPFKDAALGRLEMSLWESLTQNAAAFLANPWVRIAFGVIALWLLGRAAASVQRYDDRRQREAEASAEVHAGMADEARAQALAPLEQHLRNLTTLPRLLAQAYVASENVQPWLKYLDDADEALQTYKARIHKLQQGRFEHHRASMEKADLDRLMAHASAFLGAAGSAEGAEQRWEPKQLVKPEMVDLPRDVPGAVNPQFGAFDSKVNGHFLDVHRRNVDIIAAEIERSRAALAEKQGELSYVRSQINVEVRRLNEQR